MPRDISGSAACAAASLSADGSDRAGKLDQLVWRSPADLTPYDRNSRTHSDEQIRQIRASIDQFGFTNPILLREDGTSIGAGHGRQLASLLEPPIASVPTIILRGLSDRQWRALVIADNKLALNAGWDDALLSSEIADLDADGFDISLLGFDEEELADLGIGEDLEPAEEGDGATDVPEVSAGVAWRQWAAELAEQIRSLEAIGPARMGVTPGLALGAFLASLHDGEEYPRMMQSAFHPRIYSIAGAESSIMDALDRVASGKLDWRRLEFVCGGKMNVDRVLGSPLPFGGARIAADFPASLARDLIDEFAAGGSVCDPCHGWGGRLIGFLLSSAIHYAGTDPAPATHAGVCKIRDTFTPHTGKAQGVELFNLPAESWTPPDPPTRRAGYDLILTSPPYFDVEKYEGGEQSREKFGEYDAWRDGFYAELIRRAFVWLKPGGTFALQVGSQAYPLLADGKRLGKAAGFRIGEIRATDMANNFQETAEEDGEVVLLLHKPAARSKKAKASA